MGVRGILVSFDEDASPNGAEGFQSWLQGMIDFHLPNMSVALTITDEEPAAVPQLTDVEQLADAIWHHHKNLGRYQMNTRKIMAIKELRRQTGRGLKESKDYIDAAAVRNP